MRYMSLSSGIEAATVAWHPIGWVPVLFSEIAPFPSKLLNYYYPWVPNIGDMTKAFENEYFINNSADLIVAGTPCQSFSIAGLRGGLDTANGNLALVFCRILLHKQPRWFVWENVPGVFSSNHGTDFSSILTAFRECGYSCAYRVFDSQYFGVPQRRRRVFVVGYLGDDWRPPAAVLFERESLRRDFTPRRKKGQEVAGTLDARTNGGGFTGSDGAMNGHVVATLDASYAKLQGASGQDLNHGHSHLVAFGGNNTSGPIHTATARFAGIQGSGRMDFESETFIVHPTLYSIMPQNSNKDYKARQVEVAQPLMAGGPVGGNQGGDYVVTAGFMSGQGAKAGGIGYQEHTSPTLKASASSTNTIPAVFAQNSRDEARYIGGDGQVAGDLSAQPGMKQQNYVHGSSIRRLTPLECERLQGFPDNYTNIPGASDSARYKAIGNSMTTHVMSWIGQRIDLVDKIIKELNG